jgi:hypothetical protein
MTKQASFLSDFQSAGFKPLLLNSLSASKFRLLFKLMQSKLKDKYCYIKSFFQVVVQMMQYQKALLVNT